jgi:hypothetical protein
MPKDHTKIVKEFCMHHFCGSSCPYWKSDNCVVFCGNFPMGKMEEYDLLISRKLEDVETEELVKCSNRFSKRGN